METTPEETPQGATEDRPPETPQDLIEGAEGGVLYKKQSITFAALAAKNVQGVRLSCQILCDHDMTVRAISRLAGSGRQVEHMVRLVNDLMEGFVAKNPSVAGALTNALPVEMVEPVDAAGELRREALRHVRRRAAERGGELCAQHVAEAGVEGAEVHARVDEPRHRAEHVARTPLRAVAFARVHDADRGLSRTAQPRN